ncbi:APC family permease [Acidithiobacillus sp. IBUN Pt1247-S3]|uniref:APC family permease n=1 Tax=Acidithiobacillus sp. IBUN Pt1247-S3 TaxID=3166642 RepID=UPI0034E530FC
MSSKLKREVGFSGLIFASLGGIIGSGWLFGPLDAARVAGPLSIGSWAIGALTILLLGLTYAEVGPLFPRAGAAAHIANVVHGNLLGKIWAWLLFMFYIAIAPVEVVAVLTYANNYIPGLLQGNTGLLSGLGLIAAVLLLGVMFLLNFLGIKRVAMVFSGLGWWKLAIPILTIIVLVTQSYHPENLHILHFTSSFHGMFVAVASSGIVFSYLGFRQAIELGGEAKNPGKHIPGAVIGAIVVGAIIYVGLQWAFLVAMPPDQVTQGWQKLNFPGLFGPFAAIATLLGIGWLAVLIYADALISPGGTALVYATSAARAVVANGEVKAGPSFFTKISPTGVPWVGVIVAYVIGCLYFLPFPSWQKLVGFITTISVITYGIGPIVLLQLRRSVPDLKRPFRLRGAQVIAPIAFVLSSLVAYWGGFQALTYIFGALFGILIIYAILRLIRGKESGMSGFYNITWIFPYFIGLWLLSYFGPKVLGGTGDIAFFWSMLWVALLAIVSMLWALKVTVPDGRVAEYFASMADEGISL